MFDARIASIIQTLKQVSERPAMYVGSHTSAAIATFLSGFDIACQACGLSLSHEMRQQAKEERGWPRSAEVWSVAAMRERGLSDEAIADEMLAIDIGAWRRMEQANLLE